MGGATIRVHWRSLMACALAAGAIILIGIGRWRLGQMWREAGYNLTYAEAWHKQVFIVLSPPVLAIAIVLLVALGWRRCGAWDRPIQIMLALGIGAVWIASASFPKVQGGDPFLEGLAQRLTVDDTIDKIKLWASEHPGFDNYEFVQGLPMAYVRVSKDGSTAELSWGGGPHFGGHNTDIP
jgi:hypothetical protein